MSKKRRREQPSVNNQLIEIYEDLANERDEVRLKAALTLLSTTSKDANPSSEHIEKVFNRLIRGLCSGRKAARLGFSVAFTELLAQQWSSGAERVDGFNWGISEIIQLLDEQTQVGGSVSGQEERDHHLGRLFGSEAIIQSNVLFQSGIELDHWVRILDFVFDIAKKKSWLREECGWVLTNAVEVFHFESDGARYAQILLERLFVNGLADGLEGVAIWLTASKSFPNISKPQGLWHHQSPLSRIQELKRAFVPQEILTKEKGGTSAHVTQNSSWKPKPHFAWDVVLRVLLENETSNLADRPRQITIKEFWTEFIDNTLFAMLSSDQRKYWGFLIFQRYVQDVPKGFIHIIFGKNYIRCLVNQLSYRGTYLHLMARRSLDAICQRVSTEPEVATIIVDVLLASKGYESFDNIMKSNMLEKILAQVDFKTIQTVIPLFEHWILQPRTQDEKTASVRRQAVADVLLTFVRPRSTQDDLERIDIDSTLSQVLAIFTKLAYFRTREEAVISNAFPEPSISPRTREMFKSKITSSLTNLSKKDSDASHHSYNIVRNIRTWEKNNEFISAVFEGEDVSSESIQRAWRTLREIHSEEQSADSRHRANLKGFKLLYSIIILQVYNGEADALNILDEVQDCYTSLSRPGDKEQDPSSEVLIEILLSLVSRQSQLYRRIAQHVFGTFASYINAEGLRSMLKVLETDEDMSGQSEMFEYLDEEPNGTASSGGDESSVDEDGASSLDESDMDHTSEVEDADSGGDNEELAAFNAKLADALGTRDNVEGSDDSDDSLDMNDEQMEALEPQLTQVFRERKKITSNKVGRKVAKENVVNFKARVLDLLEIYIKQQYTNILALDLIIPLLALIHKTKSKQISTRACALLKDYLTKYRPKDKLNVNKGQATLASLRNLLDQVHTVAIKYSSKAYGDTYSKASLLVSKILVANGGTMADLDQRYERTRRIYEEDPACKIKPIMFESWTSWRHSMVDRLRGDATC